MAALGVGRARAGWLVRRMGVATLTLLLASVVIFAVLHAVPGDPAVALAGADASPATLAALRAELGVDQPLITQYLRWLGGAVSGDLGSSYVIGGRIDSLLADGLRNTAALALAALAIAALIAALLSFATVASSARWLRAAVAGFEVLGIALPPFVTGVLLVELFAVVWPVLPAGGIPPRGYFADPGITVQYLLLPAVCLGIPVASTLTRFFSEALRTEWAKPYVLTARAAGVPTRRILVHGAARNALPPVITVFGVQAGQLIGSAVLVEAIFAWPGLGQLLGQGIAARDYPVVQAVLLVAVTAFIVIALLTDISYRILDPTRRTG
ncbi:Binding-protein-dependent transport systems inner membrane component OS=Tsukamurella paurometabola(strain ATCC 8368 / DSM / CCUG 35730 / CIP 100753 / JCM 10117 / KCTC 9821 / NBRC 16120 / NCIMB 702349 / NCTC 13040)OX=521096 GN=Tpau_3605 PE=3 SV=1 [Tsukamurella paurometabola]|uniref:Binding-protein-dependent transport systems inner membrane component n=1 Tax=Tsukamurella paurometabola (strain ATCC 8368 / DSM 20162 / CCUG 35730 / CIP 100753 / JCM 10117 / KCTC 9821 / NBRC 16120 / NCIMB 702349 / NCTC 13040) TaxID=521096 RepID=D5UXU6_TSUPD|nr:ABC transporter permease [Tsukamurella paurometabola]ADG80183.1 binding-protein-dependent transport systems inner membrane component [Tsukamurella paurometabola DSM 20162]SUP38744.1 Glutathione transport system permease protein gsiC [Tsukamurella paurometabola]